jgi:hypothetical protein
MTRNPLISRRSMLRGLGGAALALPFLELLDCSKQARAAGFLPPKRLLIVTTPNGTNPATHWPTGSGSSFALSPILSPFEPYKQNLLVLRGVDNLAAKATGVNGHTDAVRCMLTGRRASNRENDDYTAGGGISVDQFIAAEVGKATPQKSLEYVTSYIYAKPPNYCSFYAAGQPAPFEDEPAELFKRVFGGLSSAPDDPAAVARRAGRTSVLQAVYKNYAALRPKLGAADRERLQAHMTRVEELEQRLTSVALRPACTIPEAPADSERRADVGLDILVQAFACDITRVATVRTQFWDDYPQFGVTGSYHDDYLHRVKDSPTAAAMVDRVKTHQATSIGRIIERLRAVPEGEGTLFDSTLVVWVDEFCHGYSHTHHEIPYVLLSGSDRFFKMGRYLHYTEAVSTNRLLNSLIQAMEVPGAGQFGDPEFGNAPLSELA